jgi:glycosyltransferase involved in cell wall biosynthesis
LGLSPRRLTLVACGRLNWVKGWPFLLEVLKSILQRDPTAQLIFVGDGEDRSRIERETARMYLDNHVKITGFVSQAVVHDYLNAADVGVVGSHAEGWSLAMLELLACGKPLVSTDVSGARDMIRPGKNGFVCSQRQPDQFAAEVLRAAHLTGASEVSLEIAAAYSMNRLAADLGRLWKPLGPRTSSAAGEVHRVLAAA